MSNTTDTDTDCASLVDWTPETRYHRAACGTHGQMRALAACAYYGMGREARPEHWVYERYAGGGAGRDGWVVWRRAWVRRGQNEQWELLVTFAEG